jgi:hypothetical protein
MVAQGAGRVVRVALPRAPSPVLTHRTAARSADPWRAARGQRQPVEGVAGPVVTPGSARVAVPGIVVHVTRRRTGVEGRGVLCGVKQLFGVGPV